MLPERLETCFPVLLAWGVSWWPGTHLALALGLLSAALADWHSAPQWRARAADQAAARGERAPNRNASQGYSQRPEPAGQGSAMASAFAKLQGLKK